MTRSSCLPITPRPRAAFPRHFLFSVALADRPAPSNTQRVIIYPAYINKKLTVAEGRKVPTSKGD